MKLLVVTQTLDTHDPVLGFFPTWVSALAGHFETVTAIALGVGSYAPPSNVSVHSLGKEKGKRSSLEYGVTFLNRAWSERNNYDAVLVHMNQEYVLLAGLMWFLMGKRVYMWRNHYAGSLLTDLAAVFCKKVFYTSRHSYTARYDNSVQMPVGVDTERFSPQPVTRVPRSILFFGRIAPSKRTEMFIGALSMLDRKGITFSASIVGNPLPKDEAYYRALKERALKEGLARVLTFRPGISNVDAPALYRTHDIYVNASPSGMFDKTIFEAAACGATVLTSSEDYRDVAGSDFFFTNEEELARALERVLKSDGRPDLSAHVAAHALSVLAKQLTQEMV